MEEKTMLVCEKCGKQGPVFNETGQHNFCPTSAVGGDIITVCMECKINEEVARWARDK